MSAEHSSASCPSAGLRLDFDVTGSHSSRCSRLAAFFTSRSDEWVDGRELSTVRGSYAWRTRVSDLRRSPYNLTIENRQRRVGRHIVSEYRLVQRAERLGGES